MSRKSIIRNHTAGFTLIETLFSLAITLMITLSIASIMHVVTLHRKLDVHSSNYEIAAKQIAQTLVTAKYLSFGEHLVYVDENNKEYTIAVDNHRIVKTPGFDIYAHGVDAIYFRLDNHKVYLEIINREKKENYLVGSDYYQEVHEESSDEEQ